MTQEIIEMVENIPAEVRWYITVKHLRVRQLRLVQPSKKRWALKNAKPECRMEFLFPISQRVLRL